MYTLSTVVCSDHTFTILKGSIVDFFAKLAESFLCAKGAINTHQVFLCSEFDQASWYFSVLWFDKGGRIVIISVDYTQSLKEI